MIWQMTFHNGLKLNLQVSGYGFGMLTCFRWKLLVLPPLIYADDLGPIPSNPTQGPNPISPITRGILKRIQEAGGSQNLLESEAIQFKWAKEDIKI